MTHTDAQFRSMALARLRVIYYYIFELVYVVYYILHRYSKNKSIGERYAALGGVFESGFSPTKRSDPVFPFQFLKIYCILSKLDNVQKKMRRRTKKKCKKKVGVRLLMSEKSLRFN